MNSCKITSETRDRLSEKYTALHEGKTPNGFVCESWKRPVVSRVIGRATEIQYKKKIPDGEPYYHHPWAEQAQPKIAICRDRSLVIYAGRYETTRRGIEDRVLPGMPTVEYLKQPYVQEERLPSTPRELITLGTLDWIRYTVRVDGRLVERELRFSSSNAPEIAHDEKGDLHILGGQYQISNRGVENPMKRSHRKPHRSHRRGHRSNPTASRMSRGQVASRSFLNAIVVGGVATASGIALDLLFARIAMLNSLSTTVKSVAKIGVGLGAGFGTAMLRAPAPVVQGIMVGGVVDGLLGLYQQYLASRVNAAVLPATSTTTAPSGMAYLPAGGIPRQYVGVSPAACAVRY